MIYGPTPAEIVRKYTALTGRPALPPRWSFGLWLSTSFLTDYDEPTVKALVEGMAERDIPLSVFHFDCYWMQPLQWCDFEWDPRRVPRARRRCSAARPPRAAAQRVDQPVHRAALAALPRGRRGGYLVRRPDGSVWQWDMWVAGMGLVDFTNPAARAGSRERCRPCSTRVWTRSRPTSASGSRWTWCGTTDRIRSGCTTTTATFTTGPCSRPWRRTGAPARPCCSPAPRPWAASASRCTGAATASRRTCRWRSRCAAGCRWGWAGSASGATTSAASRARRRPALFKRWVAFGLMSSHSRLHGSSSHRVPWAFGEEAVEVTATFARLKNSLMPYLWAAAVQAHEEGIPMMRAMVLGFPDDRDVRVPGPPVHARAGPARRARCSPTRARSRSTCRRASGRAGGTAAASAGRGGCGSSTGSTRCRCWCGPAR